MSEKVIEIERGSERQKRTSFRIGRCVDKMHTMCCY